MSFFKGLLAFTSILFSISSFSQSIERVEPPNWWVGMNTPLQLMIYGKDLNGATVTSQDKSIIINKVFNADSPDYIFIDVNFKKGIIPGVYKFNVNVKGKKLVFDYNLDKRRIGSAQREGFSQKDFVYLLMPDRFANGNSLNDSVDEGKEKYSPKDVTGRHGGDIQGIINNLDYISSLGVTVIWPTPLLYDNEARASYHGYACADYYKIDPRYGSNELYREFVSKAKEKGIKIVIDFVPNHCGISHWWMSNLPFNNWINQFPEYTRSNFAMSTHSDNHASEYDKNLLTKGWFDNTMPDMNLLNPFVLTYLTQNIIWWTEWADLSGIRVDTYPYSDKFQIAKLTKNILNEYPFLKVVAESWYYTPAEVAYWEGDALNHDNFNSNLTNVMDFPLQEMIAKGFSEEATPGWGEGMFRIYRSLSQDFVYKNPFELFIFADNHDTNRISEKIKSSPTKLKMILSLLATMRGIPQMYYGTEMILATKDGVLGHGEERLNMPGGWDGDAKSVFREINLNNNELEVLNFTKKLFTWRKTSNAISGGTFKHFWPNDNLYVYFRILQDEIVMVVINNNTKSLRLDWNIYKECTQGFNKGFDILSKKNINIGEQIEIDQQTSLIIEFKK